MQKSFSLNKFLLCAISVMVSTIIVFACIQVPKRAIAAESPHIVIAWMGGYTARVWEAQPMSQWKNLWMRSTDRYARNADGIPVANFEVYTADYNNENVDINSYHDYKYTVTQDLVPDYANTPIKIFVEYLDDGTFDVIEGTLDNWASIAFELPRSAIITICRYVPEGPGEHHINIHYYSPKTGIF